MSVDETINTFYRDLIRGWQEAGLAARFVGGQACLDYGIAQFTKDLDLIVSTSDAETLLAFLANAQFEDVRCTYRIGHGSPLASPWLDGGWTSHFVFRTGDPFLEPSIDVFAAPPRVLTTVEQEPAGLLASCDTVAKMKKTRRLQDWGYVTALGKRMLDEGDERGLLHIYDAELLARVVEGRDVSGALVSQRPALALAGQKHSLFSRAVQTEIDFWSNFDRRRLSVYKEAWVAYFRRVRDIPELRSVALLEQHETQRAVAEDLLPPFPLQTYGVTRLLAEARELTMTGLSAELVQYLPDTSALETHLSRVPTVRRPAGS